MIERVRIERIAAGGDGVGRLEDGRVAFVPRTAPGDVTEIQLVKSAARFVRGTVVRILEPGPDRIEPVCPHYRDDRCGGCQLQHLSGTAQRAARRAIVGDALRRIARLDLPDPPLEPAPEDWGYRSRISLAVAGGRIGYHRFDRPGAVFDLRDCPIAAPRVNALWARLRAVRGKLPERLVRLVVRLDREGGEHLIVETGPGPVWAGGKALAAAIDEGSITVWWRPDGGAARAVAGTDSAYPATAFEQVNPAMGDRVRSRAVDWLGAVEGRHLWDLYAGIGDTARAVALRGGSVEAVEWDGTAAAEATRRLAGARGVEVIHGAVERVIGALRPPDLVVANPPRAGLDPAVVGELARRLPERVVYVSCDPATLARDLARLAEATEGRYPIAAAEAFDLFPQTAHVETMVLLERR